MIDRKTAAETGLGWVDPIRLIDLTYKHLKTVAAAAGAGAQGCAGPRGGEDAAGGGQGRGEWFGLICVDGVMIDPIN
jgi:hypothetical protein